MCDKLPFSAGNIREAIEVTISKGAAQYTHVVRLRHAAEATPEKGAGTLSGQNITLQGTWQGGNRKYEAKYSGTFVWRCLYQRNADLERWRQDHQSCLRRDDQAAAAHVPAA